MANKQIATYLNDHLTGSVAALELLKYLETVHAGRPLERFFAKLQKEVQADRQELKALGSRLQVDQSRIQQANAESDETAHLYMVDAKIGDFNNSKQLPL